MLPQVMPEETLQAIHLNAKDSSSTLPKRMDGKIAIVTGGARGIGEATVRLFDKHGARVVIADIDDAAGIALADSLSTSVTYFHCDVSLEEDIKNLVNFTISKHGRLDILLNNAGVLLGNQSKLMSITDFDTNELDNVIRTNVRGAALGIKYAAKVMVPRRSGCIISTASVAAGLMGWIGPHAIVGLTKNTACELGKYGIRVNCISPFTVATSMLVDSCKSSKDCKEDEEHYIMDLGKPIEKEQEKFESGLGNLIARDIAEAAVYLASDESKYVSGHNLVVDGGLTTSKNCVGL